MVLLVGYDDVDVIGAPEAMVCDAQKTIRVRWQIDADDFRGFVSYDIQKSRILMCKSIVILSPDGCGQEDV